MNADFIRIAHRKAVWAKLQELLLDQFVAQDGPAKEQIICEEVPYSSKDVTNEALLEVLELIQQHELDEQLEMKQFEFKRRRPKDADDGKQAAAPIEAQAQGAGPRGGEPQPEPTPAPAGGDGRKQPVAAGGGK